MVQNDGFPKTTVHNKVALTQDIAESLAVEALAFLATDRNKLERFLSSSGLSVDNLRAAAATPGFFSAILDHLASDESLLLAFAANAGHDPATIAKARERLSPTPEMP
ncbi:MAG TPA: DUF3572 domain-containing protein [Beijerinckia sp.]|jgi:hypothetical protein|nr:DUF3572 domain-containing protein [Beijerinckia sp.]